MELGEPAVRLTADDVAGEAVLVGDDRVDQDLPSDQMIIGRRADLDHDTDDVDSLNERKGERDSLPTCDGIGVCRGAVGASTRPDVGVVDRCSANLHDGLAL